MKILHVPNAYFPVIGGSENNCRRFSEILTSQGHDVHVVTTLLAPVRWIRVLRERMKPSAAYR
jgi:hypothetical protein